MRSLGGFVIIFAILASANSCFDNPKAISKVLKKPFDIKTFAYMKIEETIKSGAKKFVKSQIKSGKNVKMISSGTFDIKSNFDLPIFTCVITRNSLQKIVKLVKNYKMGLKKLVLIILDSIIPKSDLTYFSSEIEIGQKIFFILNMTLYEAYSVNNKRIVKSLGKYSKKFDFVILSEMAFEKRKVVESMLTLV